MAEESKHLHAPASPAENRGEYARSQIQSLALMSILIALGVALGFAFASIPNVELVTGTVFLSGMILGKARGTAAGVMTEALYSIFSPYGIAPLPMLAAQCAAMG
ncbi:ECF transporter S component, partial [bacterium]|nr:ECF transporter S component [bacterium]